MWSSECTVVMAVWQRRMGAFNNMRRRLVSGICFLVLLILCGVLVVAADVSIPTVGLQLWLKADEGVVADGLYVTRWEDQSGNGRDAVAGENANPILLSGKLNSKPVVYFDGATSYVVVPHDADLDATEGLTTVIVFRWERGFRLAQKRSNSYGVDPDAWFLTTNGGLGASGVFNNEKLYPEDLWHIQIGIADVAAGTISLYGNRNLLATVEGFKAQEPNTDDLYIGKRFHSKASEGYLGGDIAEVIIYNRPLNSQERVEVETYLAGKYGILYHRV